MAGGVVRKRKFLLTRASTLFCPAALPTEAAASTSLLHLVEGDAAHCTGVEVLDREETKLLFGEDVGGV